MKISQKWTIRHSHAAFLFRVISLLHLASFTYPYHVTWWPQELDSCPAPLYKSTLSRMDPENMHVDPSPAVDEESAAQPAQEETQVPETTGKNKQEMECDTESPNVGQKESNPDGPNVDLPVSPVSEPGPSSQEQNIELDKVEKQTEKDTSMIDEQSKVSPQKSGATSDAPETKPNEAEPMDASSLGESSNPESASGSARGKEDAGPGDKVEVAEEVLEDTEAPKKKKTDPVKAGTSGPSRSQGGVGLRPEFKNLTLEEQNARLLLQAESFHEMSDTEYEFPSRMEDFGYKFNREGELRSIDKNERFVYKMRESNNYNQQRYEALGELITVHIYNLLEKEIGLEKHPVPNPPPPPNIPMKTFIFASRGAFQKEYLLVLINGSGVVRAGQWSRKLIINENIEIGSQIPYIQWGLKHGYGVVVLNTNDNRIIGKVRDKVTKEYNVVDIKCSRTPEEHAQYVWDKYIKPSKVKHIAFVAHSYGGLCVAQLAKDKVFRQRVYAVALTDSIHSLEMQESGFNVRNYFNQVAMNWITSDKPANTKLPPTRRTDAPRRSAGTTKHEWTSHTAKESVFKYLTERIEENEIHPYKDEGLCTTL